MSACTLPTLATPNPPDILSAIVAALSGLGITIPPPPALPFPGLFCPLD